MWWHRTAKRFISKTETKENDMVVFEFGYGKYAVPPKDALAMAEILQRAEKYEKKYRKDEVTGTSDYTYHVYTHVDEIVMTIINDDHYRLAKLAGKPEK
jgi:hypothetical protein